ncbi:hypothetical protein HG535_0A06000 [Zygotorulaspora mrakii]|uniref:4'-phosphopantetheinyl transferase domain-containing protein n=1 Tax=Zygotorulaspora mrakii TaxID=42260 RepID=A0A7H9AW85_ZYGMR|nr:uncharacterized protein HG535_0A06000 [Zygotorulaspora mrakii]QLG70658.1 hypothetical protein HG535_0A06000 [Zygotorulaspora mrakii]
MHQSLTKGCLVGVGTDIVYLPRIAKLLDKYTSNRDRNISRFHKITQKFMHPIELNQLDTLLTEGSSSKTRLTTFIGGVWASKESTYKALSCFVPHDMIPPAKTIYTGLFYKMNAKNGYPTLQFDDKFQESHLANQDFYRDFVKIPQIKPLISIAHDHDYLACFVSLSSYGKAIEK